jgi:hypothetical protein
MCKTNMKMDFYYVNMGANGLIRTIGAPLNDYFLGNIFEKIFQLFF